MPVNLNAFIRYRTIDACLKNQFITCDIGYLISKCSEAISNKAGEIKSVSERTVRNDIRTLRSDILGFNAPIVCEDGIYKYLEPEFSIFNTPIADTELLIEIQNLLVEEFDHINSPKAKNLIYSIATITGVKIPKKCAPAGLDILEKRMPSSKPIVRTEDELYKSSINDYLLSLSIKKKEEQKKGLKDYFGKFKTKPIEVFKWEFIFGAV